MTSQDSTQAGAALGDAVLRAILKGSHMIEVDKVTLYRDEDGSGDNALAQMCRRIESALTTHASQQAAVVAGLEAQADRLAHALSSVCNHRSKRSISQINDDWNAARSALAAYHAMKEQP